MWTEVPSRYTTDDLCWDSVGNCFAKQSSSCERCTNTYYVKEISWISLVSSFESVGLWGNFKRDWTCIFWMWFYSLFVICICPVKTNQPLPLFLHFACLTGSTYTRKGFKCATIWYIVCHSSLSEFQTSSWHTDALLWQVYFSIPPFFFLLLVLM